MTSNYSRGPGDVGAGGQQGAGGLPGQAAKRGRGPVPSPKSLMENGLSLVATGKSVVVGCAPSSSHAPVAQLDRVPGYEPGGREFESLRARHLLLPRQGLGAVFLSHASPQPGGCG